MFTNLVIMDSMNVKKPNTIGIKGPTVITNVGDYKS